MQSLSPPAFTFIPGPRRNHVIQRLVTTLLSHCTCVDASPAVSNNLLDHALLLEVFQCLPRQRAVDLQPVDEDCDGDEAVGLHVFVELLGGGFIEHDGVVGLVLDWLPVSKSLRAREGGVVRSGERCSTFALGPLLLLFLAARGCCGRLSLLSAACS